MEMNEKELLSLISSGQKVAIKVWMNDCPKCDEFKPVFEKVAAEQIGTIADNFACFNLPARPDPKLGSSEFKKLYMKPNPGSNSIGAPAVMVFEKGELKSRHYGKMSEAELISFIAVGAEPLNAQKEKAKQELILLFARRGELSMFLEELPHLDAKINQIKQFLGAQ